jgi:diaminopimelate epimerase
MDAAHFAKFQGTGNDFILINNFDFSFSFSQNEIERLCHRRFGIGADGLILVQPEAGFDFRMVYFNSDGRESTFCGNGGRCVVAFAKRLGLIDNKANFLAKDGPHEAEFQGELVQLKMRDVEQISEKTLGSELFTGSPHLVRWVDDLENLEVKKEGASIRYSPEYQAEGININFIKKTVSGIYVRTYERGVEDETYSCGTGVTASALVASTFGLHSPITVSTPGGNLQVEFEKDGLGGFRNVYLTGPAQFVFEGSVSL